MHHGRIRAYPQPAEQRLNHRGIWLIALRSQVVSISLDKPPQTPINTRNQLEFIILVCYKGRKIPLGFRADSAVDRDIILENQPKAIV